MVNYSASLGGERWIGGAIHDNGNPTVSVVWGSLVPGMFFRAVFLVALLGCPAISSTHTRRASPTLAFPTAEGYGKYTVGDLGVPAYEVTNLNVRGEGSPHVDRHSTDHCLGGVGRNKSTSRSTSPSDFGGEGSQTRSAKSDQGGGLRAA